MLQSDELCTLLACRSWSQTIQRCNCQANCISFYFIWPTKTDNWQY